jgi:hypothetical protein
VHDSTVELGHLSASLRLFGGAPVGSRLTVQVSMLMWRQGPATALINEPQADEGEWGLATRSACACS